MKKGKLTLGLITGTVSLMALSACYNPTYNPNGYILTYTDANGQVQNYSAEELFGTYYYDSSSVSTMFNKIYELVVRNYFNDESHATVLASCQTRASANLQAIKEQCEKDASANGTWYDDEFAAVLSERGAATEDDLYQILLYSELETEFEDAFYEDNIDFIRDASIANGDDYDGYLVEKDPYHVSHLLVNVDAASGAYYDGQISSDNAKKLYNVAHELADATLSFGDIAKIYSDDSESASNFGELGIMDKDTGYINEFKLGVYAYEQIYNTTTSTAASTSSTAMDNGEGVDQTKTDLTSATGNTTIGTIPFDVFEKLSQYADTTTGYNQTAVNDGNASYYPRNIYFNKYLNKHNVSVITPNTIVEQTWDGTQLSEDDEVGVYNAEYARMSGFKTVEGLDINGDGAIDDNDKVLCTSNGEPILVVRGGSDSYQGIHFIVVNRSPFAPVEEGGVTLSQYYTTYSPDSANYPTDSEGNPLETYVNFFDEGSIASYRDRANQVESTITGSDSHIEQYIFTRYYNEQALKINDPDLETAIFKWIESQEVISDQEAEQTWNETWRTYIETLEQQTTERTKRISEACAISYTAQNKDDSLWGNGGPCDDRQ